MASLGLNYGLRASGLNRLKLLTRSNANNRRGSTMPCVNKMKLCLPLMLAGLLILSGCSIAPTAPNCPEPPELSARVSPGPSFRDKMQEFLSGKLPEQTKSEQD